VPFKNATIKRLNLPVDQVSLLKLDLHYSHKTKAVLKLLKKHNIAVVFIPARCTDVLQECDTVVNKPFKSGLKVAFRDFLHKDLDSFRGDKSQWTIKLTMGMLKPFIVQMVEGGMSVIRTDAFSKTIRHAFATDGMFEEIRGPVRQLMAATDELSLEDIPTEEEVNDKVYVMGDDEEEGGMLKVLFDDDDSDDHSDDDSDDGEDKRIDTSVKKAHNLSCKKINAVFKATPVFLAPSILSAPASTPISSTHTVVPAQVSSAVIQITPAPKRSRQVAAKKAQPMKSSIKSNGTIRKCISDTPTVILSEMSKASILFGSPSPRRTLNTVTPQHIATITPEQRVLIDMRYVPLSYEEEKKVHGVLYGDGPGSVLIREYSSIPMTVEKIRTLQEKVWIVDDVSKLNT
jgi:DDE superfamily endonuclease